MTNKSQNLKILKIIPFFVIISLFYSPIAKSAKIWVASSSNFYFALNELKNDFEKNTEHKIIVINASTGILLAQILNGAKFDIFLSADKSAVDKLIQSDYVLNEDQFNYAIGTLILYPSGDKNTDLRQKLQDIEIKKIALANPKFAPYGKAALEVINKFKLYELIKQKIIRAENIAQTYHLIASDNVDLAFLAQSYLMQPNNQLKQDYLIIDKNLYTPIIQQAAILRQSRDKKAVQQFFAYLQSIKAKKIIEKYGYETAK